MLPQRQPDCNSPFAIVHFLFFLMVFMWIACKGPGSVQLNFCTVLMILASYIYTVYQSSRGAYHRAIYSFYTILGVAFSLFVIVIFSFMDDATAEEDLSTAPYVQYAGGSLIAAGSSTFHLQVVPVLGTNWGRASTLSGAVGITLAGMPLLNLNNGYNGLYLIFSLASALVSIFLMLPWPPLRTGTHPDPRRASEPIRIIPKILKINKRSLLPFRPLPRPVSPFHSANATTYLVRKLLDLTSLLTCSNSAFLRRILCVMLTYVQIAKINLAVGGICFLLILYDFFFNWSFLNNNQQRQQMSHLVFMLLCSANFFNIAWTLDYITRTKEVTLSTAKYHFTIQWVAFFLIYSADKKPQKFSGEFIDIVADPLNLKVCLLQAIGATVYLFGEQEANWRRQPLPQEDIGLYVMVAHFIPVFIRVGVMLWYSDKILP